MNYNVKDNPSLKASLRSAVDMDEIAILDLVLC